MVSVLQADSADTVTMITRTAVLRARVGVMSGMDIGIIGMLMKCGAADGVKVRRLSGHAYAYNTRKDSDPCLYSTQFLLIGIFDVCL